MIVVALRRRRGLAALLGVGVALWGLPLVGMGALPYRVAVLAAMAVVGVGDALVDVGLFTLPTRLVPDAVLARWFGALECVIALSVAAGALVVPPLLDLLGARWTLVAVGLVGPLGVAVAWRRLQSVDAAVIVRDDAIESLRRVPMLRPLPMPAIESLAAKSARDAVVGGAVVFREGDHGDRFYVIDGGDALVERGGTVVRELGAGDCFGEIALLRDVPRTATIVARSDLQLRWIDREHFLATVNGYGSSAAGASTLAAGRLADDQRSDRQPRT